ncbi:MAG: metalloregulator ArsR/SmtB family transcription factor [[Lactobacillus] timonensis]|jgi:DNA-binding transcriptional ArsR family regulator|uniref:ArsR/SmtB family transcription factor n=1 Tax=[Lactobacillus] timonensis TaxID=1970790 RepID=UPI002352D63C|nr:metalloregulator ArsR/SmtB family transcription factor [[Lactobacillus] timonensis]MCI1925469.1 metalloregulator ArsR/SmtB family transcription factor [[Lactobacillus] timonensis]MCI1956779.1 metalloregulator ArsR/SmtB family transcription factor [[Lactobacillus] timonensis]MCI1969769.1 metalloregulator ArsR/SmtB family transcription factor [[Lactobacillus] timonensis]MCI2006018.1 metalloregulator ArsR/SmtB family transcription factor [[Lactobacillus] timonensis]
MRNFQSVDAEELKAISQVFKMLGHPKRLRLLFMLLQHSMSVSEISKELNWEQSAVSHQLQQLRRCNLVGHTRKGKVVMYHLKNPQAMTLIADIISHAEQLI